MVGLSLFRPGPIKEIDNFVQAKNNKKFAPKSLDGQVIEGAEILEPVLKETRGIIVYQEQIMEIVSIWAGYSEIEADLFRDIISKQKKHLMNKERKKFINKSAEMGRNPKSTEDLYELINRFSAYGFAKSHAASYALLTYEDRKSVVSRKYDYCSSR